MLFNVFFCIFCPFVQVRMSGIRKCKHIIWTGWYYFQYNQKFWENLNFCFALYHYSHQMWFLKGCHTVFPTQVIAMPHLSSLLPSPLQALSTAAISTAIIYPKHHMIMTKLPLPCFKHCCLIATTYWFQSPRIFYIIIIDKLVILSKTFNPLKICLLLQKYFVEFLSLETEKPLSNLHPSLLMPSLSLPPSGQQ